MEDAAKINHISGKLQTGELNISNLNDNSFAPSTIVTNVIVFFDEDYSQRNSIPKTTDF